MTHHDDGHDELRWVADRLRAERPQATSLELDALKRRVLARADRPRPMTRRSLPLMRTRAAILSMLALGFLLSTTGAGLAVGGLAGTDQASQAQYPPPPQPEAPVAPAAPAAPVAPVAPAAEAPEAAPLPEKDEKPRNEVLPERSEVLPDEVQPTRQAEAGAQAVPAEAEALPFTGFAALPVLLLGLALLSAGLVMRRSAGKD